MKVNCNPLKSPSGIKGNEDKFQTSEHWGSGKRASTGEARAAAIVLLDMPEGALKAEGTLSGQEGREGVVTPGRLEGCKTGDVSRG